MNKSQLIEFVRVSILKSEAVSDNQKTLHYQRVAQAVGYAFDTLLAQIPMTPEGKAKIEAFYVKHYYNQPVAESSGYRYFGVSDDVVSVGEGKGVWYVQPSQTNNGNKNISGSVFVYSNRPHVSFFANMAVGGAMNMTTWRFGNIATKKQIVLENIGDSPNTDIRLVDYGIVRAFTSYGDTEEVIVPDGRNDLLIQMVTEWMSPVYVDKTNNNQ